MTIVWSLPVRGEPITSTRGDLVRARSLMEALRADGHDVLVVKDEEQTGTRAAVATYRQVLRSRLPSRAALVLRDIGRVVHGFVHGVRVAETARRRRPDLIIETQVAYTVGGALAGWFTGVPLVLDDCSPGAEESAFGVGIPRLAGAILRLQVRRASRVVAVSRALADLLVREGVPAAKLICVPNGVSLDAFATASGETWRSRHKLHDRCVVGFVGSFQPWHRAELLVDAVASLPSSLGIHLLLAGEGSGLESALSAAAQQGLDSITAAGRVSPDAIPSLLAACDVGVLAHTNAYGDPMKLREYAAAGLPSVAPDLEPVREVIEHNVTGLLFPLGNARALAEALRSLAADRALRRRLGDEARRRAFRSGSWTDRSRALIEAGHHAGRPACCAAPAGAGRSGQWRAERPS